MFYYLQDPIPVQLTSVFSVVSNLSDSVIAKITLRKVYLLQTL